MPLNSESSEEPSSGQEGASRRKWPAVPAERVAAERTALQEAVAGLLGGLSSQAEIARGWNAAGLLTVTGQQWTLVSVRGTLMRPVLAGRIEHEGELISRFPGEPIIVERDWLRLRAMIEGRRRGRPPSPRYLGSGVLRCGACGKKLGGHLQGTRTGKTRTGKPRSLKERWVYVCNTQRGGCGMSIDMPGVDRELRSLTVARLSDSRYAAAIGTARSRIDERLGVVNAEIEQIEQVAAALSEKVGRREMSVADFDNSYRFLRADLQPLLEERERLNGGAVAGPTEALSTAEVARQWDDADTTEERRAMLVVAVGADQVRVLPVIPGTRANQFNPDRVVLTPADTPLTGRGRPCD
jgi:site-specific DNA recombinase